MKICIHQVWNVSMSKKGRNLQKKKTSILNENSIQENVVLDFSFDTVWISIKHKEFTNYLEDDNEFFKMHRIIFKDILPILSRVIYKYPHDFIRQISYEGLPHSHEVDSDHKKIVKDILVQIHMKKGGEKKQSEDFVNQNIGEERIYQIGHTSIRIFGYFKENIFVVLMVDYHHLVYPNKIHYNEKDYSNFKMCPIERGK